MALVGALLLACGEAPLPATGMLSSEDYHSDIIDDDYVLRTRLPPGYADDPGATYPLVIQLDPTFAGLQQYDITVGLVSDYAAAGRWPEAIVVGVDYPDPRTRDRDYLPPDPLDEQFEGDGADRFHRVLRDELLPHLEASLQIDPTQRTLIGHSNGGVFAWYELFRHDPARPPLFSGVIAADSGYDQDLFTLERWHAERSDSLPVHLFATRAIYNGAVQAVTFDAMIDRLDGRGLEGLELQTAVLETDHGGAVWPSTEAGLDFILGGDR